MRGQISFNISSANKFQKEPDCFLILPGLASEFVTYKSQTYIKILTYCTHDHSTFSTLYNPVIHRIMAPPITQKALLATAVGKPLQLVTNHPVPQPGPNQVLLKVTVAGINPHDSKARDIGLFIADNLPAVLTNDVTGTVVALGPGVDKYKIGDRVLSHPGFDGKSAQNGLQEYAVNDIGAGFKIPDSITDDEAATLPTSTFFPTHDF